MRLTYMLNLLNHLIKSRHSGILDRCRLLTIKDNLRGKEVLTFKSNMGRTYLIDGQINR